MTDVSYSQDCLAVWAYDVSCGQGVSHTALIKLAGFDHAYFFVSRTLHRYAVYVIHAIFHSGMSLKYSNAICWKLLLK